MTAPTAATEADRTLKDKHRAMWALGDYPALAADIISDLGQVLTQACGVRLGDQVLDIAAGSGNAAIPAALAGASVVACDLTPELLAAGQRQAAQQGVELEWRQADAEALPFGDDQFDVVMSCLGVMFAPHHQASADELVRVCRPGGTVGLLNWTPEGHCDEDRPASSTSTATTLAAAGSHGETCVGSNVAEPRRARTHTAAQLPIYISADASADMTTSSAKVPVSASSAAIAV